LGQPELELAGAMLPGARCASGSVRTGRRRPDATVGLLVSELVERSFAIDERVQADVVIAYRDDRRASTRTCSTRSSPPSLPIHRIEQNIRLTSGETDQLTGVASPPRGQVAGSRGRCRPPERAVRRAVV
jgi:hypothetical protein